MRTKGRKSARLLQRSIQALSLGLFFWLLWGAAWPLADGILPADAFLRTDPLVAALVPVSAREWVPDLWPGLVVCAVALVFGRLFCGYICPMGVTLDLARRIQEFFAKKDAKNSETPPIALPPHWRKGKYLILAVMLGAAVVGVNLFFWGSPISLITRFYGLLLHPLGLLAGDIALDTGRPLFETLGIQDLAYLSLEPRRFDTLYFVAAFFLLLFWLERVRPRFWCRCLCPAGALLALCSLLPRWRRRVGECVSCGACNRLCPTGAIASDSVHTEHAECIACRSCVDACPTRGTAFGFSRVTPMLLKRKEFEQDGKAEPAFSPGRSLPSRRAFIGAAATGIVLAAVQYSGAHSLLRLESRGNFWSEGLIRPPGAVPEPEFLDRCLRCGECMKACPTNGLQPVWLAAGPEGMFSPVLAPRRGPCEPGCNVCGWVCPIGAIRALPLEEKQWAKVGTAVVVQNRCLAWAENRRCVVCQETCPYGSIELVQDKGAVPVPVVNSSRCFGCGYCEQHCPTRVSSIVVQPLNALRLETAEYRKTAQAAGLDLVPGLGEPPFDEVPDGRLPPGFSE